MEQKNKKKLMLITPMLNQGGLEKVCALTAQLMKDNFDVSIAVFDNRDIIYDISGIDLIDLKAPSKSGKLGKIINVFIRASKLRKIKKRKNIDIAYSFGPSANIPNVLSRNNKCKTWVGFRSYLDLGNKAKLQLICKKADKVICCAKEIESELRVSVSEIDAVTIYNPFDIAQIQEYAANNVELPWDDNQKVIVSMGRENDVKGFWHLIKSFSLVNARIQNTRLMIIGDGEYTEYRHLVDALGIGDKVHFTGVQSNPYPYLNKAHVYALTSLNEGFPNALVEAMSLSVPVVATDCLTGPAEILLEVDKSSNIETVVYGKYGILIPRLGRNKNMDSHIFEKEEEMLADALEKLLTDEKVYAEYSYKARERAEMFSYLNYQTALLDLCKSEE